MNLFYFSAVAGFAGAVIVNGLTYLFLALGVRVSLPWEIASNVFLNSGLIHTPVGVIIGLVGTVALSTAVALVISYTLKFTGYNGAWLKGIIVSNALGFINLGLFMRLLDIWPQIRHEPATNMVALINLSLLGYFQAELLEFLQRNYQQNI